MRIGMLTSGGDCQALNAAMRGVAKSLYNKVDDVQIYGFLDGYRGLINNTYKLMDINDFSGILTIGGTILQHQEHHLRRLMNLMRMVRTRLRQ